MANGTTPGFWLFGYERGRELWGWLAWVPLFVVGGTAVLILLIKRPIKWQFRMVRNIWRDWTMLSFAIYGMFILGTFAVMDEMHSPLEGIMTALGAMLLALGAGAYMRSGTKTKRAAALLFGFSATHVLLVGFSTLYWQTQTPVGSADYSPPSMIEAIISMSKGWLFFALFLLSPVVIGLLHRSTQR